MGTSTATISKQVELMVAAGASADRVVAEFAIFSAFEAWVGMAASLQTKRVTEEQFDRMIEAYWQELERQSERMKVTEIGSASYSTVFEWMAARMTRYQTVITNTEPSKVNLSIVENFCDFTFDREPGIEIKEFLKSNYEAGSLQALRTIAESRVV